MVRDGVKLLSDVRDHLQPNRTMKPVSNASLNEDEFGQLDDFLESIGPSAMSMEEVDGFFAALMCAPELVLPSKWFPEIWGPDFAFESEAQVTLYTGLLMRHWNNVSAQLMQSLSVGDAYHPVLAEDDDGVALGNAWAHGFMHGVGMQPEHWAMVLNDPTRAQWLQPILTLHHETDANASLRSRIESDDDREALLDRIPASLSALYRFFEPQRRARASGAAPAPARRAAPKIGRNDPCPCGSGKKYKQCCGALG
jgi:uncharacterized protein